MVSSDRSAPELAQTLDRGLRVLLVLGAPGRARGLTVSELAAELGVGRTVVYRLIATLEGREFVHRGADGRCRLGPAVTQLQMSLRPILVEAARPVLLRLADVAGATAHLTVAEGEEGLALLVVEPTWTNLHISYRVGSRHPLTRGSAGRAILEARNGSTGPVLSSGDLQQGAFGLAAAVPGVPGVEASVGVISLGQMDERTTGPAVVKAAAEVGRAMTRG